MLRTIANAFSVADIRKKLAFTAAMLLLYRLGAYIPAPGVNVNAVKEIQSNFGGSSILGFLNLFSGGSLSRLSLFALGIMPYITASIILQLLTVVVPSLERLPKRARSASRRSPSTPATSPSGSPSASRSATSSSSAPSASQSGASVVGTLDLRQGLLDRDLPDRRLHPADVAGGADHPARGRQWDLADDLRLDRVANTRTG